MGKRQGGAKRKGGKEGYNEQKVCAQKESPAGVTGTFQKAPLFLCT